MPEPVHVFWVIVAVLALAAACNHGWHHARDRHLTARLVRACARDCGAAVLVVEPPAVTYDADPSSGA